MIARHDADDSFAATVAIHVQESGGKANFGVVRGISQEILPVRSEMALEKGAKRLWDRLRRSRGCGRGEAKGEKKAADARSHSSEDVMRRHVIPAKAGIPLP